MDRVALQELFQTALQHRRAGRHGEAEAIYRRLLSFLPNHPDLYVNLANALEAQGRDEEAVAALEAAVGARPNYAEAYHNLGVVLRKLDRTGDAIAAYRKSLAIKPDYSAAMNNLANALSESGQTAEAIEMLQRALAVDPRSAHALCNLGGMLSTLGQTEQAIALLSRAAALDPQFAGAHLNLGKALTKADRLDDAAAACRRAIEMAPEMAEAHASLGLALHRLGELDDAIAAMQTSLRLNPDRPDVHSNLILMLLYHPRYDAAAILSEQKKWNARHARAPLPPRPAADGFENPADPERRLRIGYVSGDLCNHTVAQNLLPMFQAHDKSAFEFFFYCNNRRDAVTEVIEACGDHWRSILDVEDELAADLIRADRIDVLIDLSQHTGRNRLTLFSRQLAPVQIAFGGYPGGTGLTAMNYRISDSDLDSAESQWQYVEETLYLPDSFWLYATNITEPVGELPAAGNGFITFGCLNNFCKINEDVLNVWARILSRLPDSRLVLLGGDASQRRRAEAALKTDRIEMIPRQPRKPYMLEFQKLDIGLDTFPYNGHISSLDALWMGVPVVTLVGQRAVSRGGWSLLKNLGLEELAAANEDDYVEIAVRLAGDRQRLAELRRTLRQRLLDSPLTNARRFAANIESLYRTAWRKWCAAPRPRAGQP
jgi:protein O-GlcNAc transferase